MAGLQFGTSGLRGLVSDMTPEVCALYTRAFIRHLQAQGEVAAQAVLLGRDLRESSPAISEACAAGAQSLGCEAIDCGEVPTPALALAAARRGLPAIMITGSHIPADRNGLKFYRAEGEITKADEAGIVSWLEAVIAAPSLRQPPTSHTSALDDYVTRYTTAGLRFSLAGMRVGVYQHSSVTRDLIVRVLEALGAETIPLGRTGSFVPLDTEAISQDVLDSLHRWTHDHQTDAIVSSDGDADRPLIVDERGVALRGDIVGLLTAAFLKAQTVVTPVTSSSVIELSGLFDRTVRTRVGSPYVIAGIEANCLGTTVGFEANGGVILGSTVEEAGFVLPALPTRDALLPIIAVLASARAKSAALSELVARLPARFTAANRLENISREQSLEFLDGLSNTAANASLDNQWQVIGVNTLDGVKLTLETGETLHFRASGNAPELRCYAESFELERAENLVAEGLRMAAEQVSAR